MSLRSLLLSRRAVLGMLAVFGLMTASAKADSVTFATFAEKNQTNEFRYRSTGVAGAGGLSTFDLNPASIAVNFRYVPNTVFTTGLPAALLGNQDAHMKFVTTSATAVTVFGGFAFQQNFTGFLEITRDVPHMGLSKLLRVDFTGTLSGLNGGVTSSFGADVALGDTVTYTSDFIDFSGATDENMSLTFTSITPNFVKSLVSGFFVPFTAYGTGSFAASVVPEPSTLAGAFGGLALAGLAVLRRRAAKA